jgi:hypothetical protein
MVNVRIGPVLENLALLPARDESREPPPDRELSSDQGEGPSVRRRRIRQGAAVAVGGAFAAAVFFQERARGLLSRRRGG